MRTRLTALVICALLLGSAASAQINTFPYYQSGSNPIGWNVIQTIPIWNFGIAGVNPAGKTNDTAIVCNNFAYIAGVTGRIISPRFDFTAVARPTVHFFIAHRTYTPAENDSLIIEVSTNNGVTFINTPAPYRKAYTSDPSLSTIAPSTVNYSPSAASHWRQEIVDLSAYAGSPSIIISFRGVSGYGNNLWLDDFTVYDAASICYNTVSGPGNYTCNSLVNINMSSTGNPTGGEISVVEHLYTDPIPSQSSPSIATNNSATTHDGSIFTPNIVSPDHWFTIAYTGNDESGFSNYSLSIDVSSYASLFDITKIYIVKRSSIGGPWVCLNTTASGSMVTASGITAFSDFGIAGDSLVNPLPVELSSFSAIVNGRDVELKWTTSSELNNSGFDVERNADGSESWTKAGFVSGNGTTSQSSSYSFTDKNVPGGNYTYRLKQIDYNGNFSYYELGQEISTGVPEKFDLSQNYPNPFNPSTSINFDLPEDSKVTLKVFDMAGKEVSTLVSDFRTAGYYTVSFNALGISSGVYFYRLTSESNGSTVSAVKKMMIIK